LNEPLARERRSRYRAADLGHAGNTLRGGAFVLLRIEDLKELIMRPLIIAAAAASLAAASSAFAAQAPAGQADARFGEALAKAERAAPPASYAQWRGRYYGPGRVYGRPYYGRPYYGGNYYYRRGYGGYGGAAAAGVAGLAAGALIGGAIASQQVQPAPTYVVPGDGAVVYCAQRYRSYDPASGTFLGYDGLRHPCP
jgi:hypothetical protein